MALPNYTKITKNGVEYIDGTDRCNYTIKELTQRCAMWGTLSQKRRAPRSPDGRDGRGDICNTGSAANRKFPIYG